MLFASASFIFLFLPLSLAAFYLTPKRHRRQILLIISVLFYILANLSSPLSIAVMAAAVTATYFTGMLISPGRSIRCPGQTQADGRRGSAAVLIATVAALAILVALRIVNHSGMGTGYFPLGAAVWLLHCVSYLTDIARGDVQSDSPWDALLYLTYFPLMVVGPVVRYKVFVRCAGQSEYNVNCAAEGMRMFAVGFIERIAVAAVLVDAYEKITDNAASSMNYVLGLCAAALIFVTSFFALVGWSDMARGLSMMFGIRLPDDFGSALTACTPSDYFSCVFRGLGEWYCDYIKDPLFAALGHSEAGRAVEAVGLGCGVLWLAVWLKCSPAMLLVGLAAGALVALLELSGADGFVRRHRWLWPVGWIVTFLVASVFWTGGVVGSVSELGKMARAISVHSTDYNIFYIYIEMSGGRYIVSALVALLLVPLYRRYRQVSSLLPRGLRNVYDGLRTIVILGLFAFSLIFFMPQYPEYAVQAFKYFIF